MWVLGLYKLSWPANGSFKYVDMFFFLLLLFFFVFFFCCCFFCFFFCFVLFFFFFCGGGRRNIKGKGGSWGRGRRGYIVLRIH